MKFLDPKSFRGLDGVGYYFGEDLEGLKKATQLQKKIRTELLLNVKPGITTLKIHNLALKLIKDAGAEPLFMGYGGFPHAVCTSVNHEIVHGIARKYKLKEGDVLSLDLGVKLNGFCADSCRTVIVGDKVKKDTDELLIEVSERAFEKGFSAAIPGNTIGDVGYAIYQEILIPKDSNGNSLFDVFQQFMGHGIGHILHENPQVPNFGLPGMGKRLKPGMCICIEPVVVHSSSKPLKGKDMFTISTHDGKTACHHENQVYISDTGPVNLT